MAQCVGIDLGTTNTVVGAVLSDVARGLPVESSGCLLPSVVSFHPNGEVLVGNVARARKLIDPESTVHSVKRLIGRTWDSPEVQAARDELPFKLVQGARDAVMVEVRRSVYALPEISAFVLRRAKAAAELALHTQVQRAVVTVPANFNELQRASTKVAARLAGLDVLRILNEPTAAALAYGQQLKGAKRVAVYDLGGGTFDLTVLDLTSQVFEVLATAGDSNLGGDDIDSSFAAHLRRECLEHLRIDPRGDPVAWGRLRVLAEEWKKQLSSVDQIDETIQDVGIGPGGAGLSLRMRLSRAELEELARPLLERTLEVTRRALTAARLKTSDIHEVLLVGGATRMPLLQEMVGEFFGRKPTISIDPDQVVAIGAAISAASLDKRPLAGSRGVELSERKAPTVRRVQGNPEGSLVLGRLALISRSAQTITEETVHAARIERASRTVADRPTAPPPALPPADPGRASGETIEKRDPRVDSVPPPESVLFAGPMPTNPAELNALLQSVEVKPTAPLLLDVTPLTLRVETAGGFTDPLIRANTPIPCEQTRTFSTAIDGQTSVVVRVAQGEQRLFTENTYLGEVELGELTPAPRGHVKIAVTFEIDADGTLQVNARDPVTGRQSRTTIRLLGVADDDVEIEAMQLRHENAIITG